MQSVAADFIVQDVDAQLHIRFLHLGNQTTREAREQTLVHAFEVDRRTVAGQNDALTIAKEMIKDVEKGVLRLNGIHPFLNVIHDEHVDGLIKPNEVVDDVFEVGIDKLRLEKACTDIKHALLGIKLLAMQPNGVDEVRFSASRRTINKHGVELRRSRMLGNRKSHAARQLVARAFDIVLERKMRVELRIKFNLCHPIFRLLAAALRSIHIGNRFIRLNILRQFVLLVGDNAIGELHALAKGAIEHRTQQA